MLYAKGEKGAYRYALKFLQDKDIDKELSEKEAQAVASILVNLAIEDPRFHPYVISILNENKTCFNFDEIASRLNELIKVAHHENHDQEVISIMFLLRKLHLSIDAEIIESILDSTNDLAQILALDMIKNDSSLIGSFQEKQSVIKDKISALERTMKAEKLSGPHWLLLYECKVHNLAQIGFDKDDELYDFFHFLMNLQVSFFQKLDGAE